jgi:hypothetical protein
MNENELADWIKNTEFYENLDPHINNTMDEVEDMLRQQQAEIEALKKEAALQRLSDFTKEAEKTLTDEEIIEIWSSMETETGEQNVEFARAILKKASER